MKLSLRRFRLDIRKGFFTQRKKWQIGHWNRLSRKAVTAPKHSEFKKHLNNALRHMVYSLRLSCTGPRVGLNDPDGSLPTKDIL